MFHGLTDMLRSNAFTSYETKGYIMQQKSHDILNYAMHTKMSMLEKWRQTKVIIVTLTTKTFPISKTLNPFQFLVSHLCN